jgi:serine/threonine protein kinase
MTESTWQLAKEIFNEALSLAPAERAAYLDFKCGADRALRAEVEKLLGAYDSEFLEDNLLETAEALAEPLLPFGAAIGRYRIRELIGTGGMGQVFLADDTELDRPVAFKVLHRDVADSGERVRRFIQEARAASALNHPNILTIHEIGSHDGSRFIVSEHVDGNTLRERMRAGLTVAESIEITCQIAAALQAAHVAGIVHRDIKPENVMIRSDGLVKVLDFGLAKLTEADDQPIDPSAPLSRVYTTPGLVMGTVAYMSPEQARGLAVDTRTDLWSLGVVLHEMLTGKSPFKGDSMTELVSSILSSKVTPTDIDSLPPELTPICQKALTKDKEKRYQSAHDLLEDLKGEKKRMEYAIHPSPYISVSSTDNLQTQLIRPRPTLSAEYIVTSVKRHKYASLAAMMLVIITAVGFSVYKFNGATQSDPEQGLAAIGRYTTESDLKLSKLPISGQANESVISPDGKYVAYRSKAGIRLLDLETNEDTSILSEARSWGITFSADSKFIYYSYGGYDSTDGISRVSIKGGTPIKVVDKPLWGPTFSPDGTTMAFTRELRGGADGWTIQISNVDGSNERTAVKIAPGNYVYCYAFSTDGKTLACVKEIHESGISRQLVSVALTDGKQIPLSSKKWKEISGAVWLPNGNVVIAAKETDAGASQIWFVPRTGEPAAVTSGLSNYSFLSGTKKGDVLLSIQNNRGVNLWVMPENEPSRLTKVTNTGELQGMFSSTPDGRVVLCSDITGNRDIWIMNVDGSGRRQLTNDPAGDGQPKSSFDGKYVAFTSNRTKGVNQIFRMDMDGSNFRQLTNAGPAVLPAFAADGKWIYYFDATNDPFVAIRKVPVEGGESSLVAKPPDGWGFNGLDVNRADGRIVFGLERVVNGKVQFKLGVMQPDGRNPNLMDVPANLISRRPFWTGDNKSVALRSFQEGIGRPVDIWRFLLDGTPPTRLTDLKEPRTEGLNWSFDGKKLLLSREELTVTPVLIRNIGK